MDQEEFDKIIEEWHRALSKIELTDFFSKKEIKEDTSKEIPENVLSGEKNTTEG